MRPTCVHGGDGSLRPAAHTLLALNPSKHLRPAPTSLLLSDGQRTQRAAPGTGTPRGCPSGGSSTRPAPPAARPTWQRREAPLPSSCAASAVRAAWEGGQQRFAMSGGKRTRTQCRPYQQVSHCQDRQQVEGREWAAETARATATTSMNTGLLQWHTMSGHGMAKAAVIATGMPMHAPLPAAAPLPAHQLG